MYKGGYERVRKKKQLGSIKGYVVYNFSKSFFVYVYLVCQLDVLYQVMRILNFNILFCIIIDMLNFYFINF